jgi:alpha,alpha-trehalose phosphorylase
VWTAVVSGFGGMRDHFGKLTFDPRLPASWDELAYTVHWHGTRLAVAVSRSELRIEAEGGVEVEFEVRGTAYRVAPGESVAVPLADQGPVIAGRPSLIEFEDARREDGTILSASVPTVTTSITIITENPDGSIDPIDV